MSNGDTQEKPSVTVARNNEKHCKKCNRVDSYDDMVCCDVCESWEHFQCAGVSDSIADTNRSWKCNDCLANWDGASKISFNESSVSKSSRVSQRLQLSLQFLEEQRAIKKKHEEQAARIRKLEEEAKMKRMQEEEEYLRQKYKLLMQIEDDKDSSSRKSGVSVKSRREQMEKWLEKGAQVDVAGQSRPTTSEQKATQPAPAVTQTIAGFIVPASTVSSVVGTFKDVVALNQGMLYPDPTIPVPGGNVSALAKSYESFVPTVLGNTSSYLPAYSTVPVAVRVSVGESVVTSTVAIPTVTSSVPLIQRISLTENQNPPISFGNAPVYSYPGMSTMLSSAVGLIPSISNGMSSIHRSPHEYLPQTTTSGLPFRPISVSSISTTTVPSYPPLFPTSSAASSYPVIPSYSSPFTEIPATTITVPATMSCIAPSLLPTSLEISGTRSNPSGSLAGPTSAQLAARQVMPRELPKFNGDPEEWPIFYSSFKNTTEVCGYTDDENLSRLQRCLGGSALEAVRSLLLLPASVPYVIGTLHKLYGRPEILISSLLKKVRNVPSPKSDNLNSIVAYGLVIQNLVDHIILADQQAHLTNPMLLQELVDKLPTSLKMQWGTFKQAFVHINLATFNSFMSGLVNLASELSIGVDSAQNHQKQPRVEKVKQKEKLFTHANESLTVTKKESAVGEGTSKACSYCEKDGHQIASCFSFKSLDIGGRWKAMRPKSLCRLCLIPHRKWPCRSKKECGIDGCRIRHHMLLHSSRNDAANGAKSGETVHQNHHHTKSFSLFRYLPVTLYGNGKQVDIFVFLDDGSSSTLLKEGIAAQLGIDGEPDNLMLSWTGKISRYEKTSKRISVKISGSGKKEAFQLGNVRTVRELGLPSQTLDYIELSKTFPHLQGLPVDSYANAKPSMIVGLEHVQLLTSLKTREGSSSEPVATETRLGWCLYGRNSGNEGSIEQLHVHTSADMSNSGLHDSMRKFFAVEEAVSTKQFESEENKRARDILEATTIRRGTRIETGLIWRMDNVNFPDSYPMAVSRLKGLEKRLARDSELRRRVNEQIQGYEQKEYVRKVSPEELMHTNPQRVWYLPLGVVTNPKKPNKIRMVWDAAAKSNGVSFNDMLLKGPDLLVSLVEVLLRFREGAIAVCSDIREMFLRILIRDTDKWSQCFEFGKILSNSKEVLDQLGETGSSTNKALNLAKDTVCERVLGVVWVPSADHFTFDQTGLEEVLRNNGAVPTKRQVLRTVMKLYDPLGFVAHFVVQGKILMQEIWRTGTNWGESIAEELHDLWSRWIELYATYDEVKVPRCFFGSILSRNVEEIEIHVFTDASVAACACVAYLRMSFNESNWCALVAAKTKVAPLRTLSIPRLELQAAMMGSRLLQNVCSALTLKIRKRFLWTDSATVLAWLRSDSRRYHQFVSFRVGEILSLTSVDEWHYVPSKLNVADDATKWNSGPSFDPKNRWFQGPPFLRDPIEQWPMQSGAMGEAEAAREDLHVVAVHQTVQDVVNVERFSCWNRLVQTMAYVYRAVRIWKHNLCGESRRQVPNQQDFVKAEEILWRQVQAQAYPEEIWKLQNGRSVGKLSSLQSLAPFLDERGVIRVGGRIGNAPHISFAAKHPVVLPRDHRITFLLVHSFHRRFLHASGEAVCNELRQKFYIPKLRVVVRKVNRNCQHCKVKKAAPRPPMMGTLPKVRLTPFIRPFTYVGVDYMGPFEVKVGRSIVKRWICLFTCLTVRAIHLELVHSLSSIACVMAFRRFVARRGAPLEVFSDNGTNFVGAHRQLSEEKRKIQDIIEDCAATFTNANTQWHFNVPAAPHMGGPWQRMVKSVKVAMKAVSDSPRHPSDEVLETIMLEAEAIVNSRPLTYVPLEVADEEALTPNHFLLYGSSGIKQPATDHVTGNILRDSWKLAQYTVDEFWRRWVREYLPMLTRRTKWFEAVKPLEPGDLVVIIDEHSKNRWERGRILETFPDKTGQVRRAIVQTARGVFARPAVKLAVLNVENKDGSADVLASETEVVHGSGDVADTPRRGEMMVNSPSEPSLARRHGQTKRNIKTN